MERGCREREERCKVKDRLRREVKRVKEERGRHRQTRKVDEKNGDRRNRSISFY